MSHSDNFAVEQQVALGKNEIIENIKVKMGRCPYYRTIEILDEVLLQKESWGGKRVPENTVLLSSSANVEYVRFAEKNGVELGQTPFYYQQLFQKFLGSPKPEITEKQKSMLALQTLCAVRNAFLDEKQAMEARIRNRGKDLDIYYPIEESKRLKVLEQFRAENESLLDDLQKGLSWQNIISASMVGMGYVQKSLIEKEIDKLVEKHPMWEFFGQYVPGFGKWTCAFFLSRINGPITNPVQGPKRFPDSGKVRAFCGVAPIGGKTMKMKKGEKISYDPRMKEMLCKVWVESFLKVSARFPDEPYSKFLQECRIKQAKKAIQTTAEDLAEKWGVPVENVANLGFKEDENGVKTFLGFKIKKANGEEITTLNPGHVFQRALREFGSMFISDFYHMWLFLEGENPDTEGNPRIMAVLAKAKS